MRTERTPRERVTDALLSLVLFNACASEDGGIGDRLKATKLLFLASHDLFSKQIKALNFSFYRYSYGPFTPELYETWGELNWMGYLDIEAGPVGRLSLTKLGRDAARRYEALLDKNLNDSTLGVFRQVCDGYTALGTRELLRRVYETKVTPVGWQRQIAVGEVPEGAFLTAVLEPQEALESARIDDSLLSSFFNEVHRADRPPGIRDAAYRRIYESAVKGLRAEKAGLSSTDVSLAEIRKKANSS